MRSYDIEELMAMDWIPEISQEEGGSQAELCERRPVVVSSEYP